MELISQCPFPDPVEISRLAHDSCPRFRRHLIVENAIVLPIAQARLTESDIVRLRIAKIQRRIAYMQA